MCTADILIEIVLCTADILGCSADAEVDAQGRIMRKSGQQQKGSPTLPSADTGKLLGVTMSLIMFLHHLACSVTFSFLYAHISSSKSVQQVSVGLTKVRTFSCEPACVKLVQNQCWPTDYHSCLIRTFSL